MRALVGGHGHPDRRVAIAAEILLERFETAAELGRPPAVAGDLPNFVILSPCEGSGGREMAVGNPSSRGCQTLRSG